MSGADLARRGRAAVLGTAMAGAVGALTPVWWAHDRAARAVTARRTGGVVGIERAPLRSASLDELVGRRAPVVVTGFVDELGLGGVADRAGLVERVGDRTATVTLHDAAMPYFLYSGGYGSRPVERRSETVASLLDLVFDGGLDEGAVVYQLLGAASLGGGTQRVLDEVDAAISARCSVPTETRFSGVWIGSPGVVTPLHHDAWPGILVQTEGRKRVAMYGPLDRPNLAFRSPLHGAGRWSRLPGRSADADPAEFPRLAHATRHEVVLEAGEALVIPPYWSHEMEAVTANISIPFRFRGRWRNWANPGFLRPATELLRKQAATAVRSAPR